MQKCFQNSRLFSIFHLDHFSAGNRIQMLRQQKAQLIPLASQATCLQVDLRKVYELLGQTRHLEAEWDQLQHHGPQLRDLRHLEYPQQRPLGQLMLGGWLRRLMFQQQYHRIQKTIEVDEFQEAIKHQRPSYFHLRQVLHGNYVSGALNKESADLILQYPIRVYDLVY